MAYTSWSVVFGEQPSAAKWNIIGTNAASFNDSTGINLQYANLVGLSNPYKFRGYRNAALTSVNTTPTALPYDAESWDTNNNFDIATNKGRYTAPVAGFYHFSATLQATSNVVHIMFYKNGSLAADGVILQGISSSLVSVHISEDIQLAVNDYVEVYYSINGAVAFAVGASATYFSGFLVTKT